MKKSRKVMLSVLFTLLCCVAGITVQAKTGAITLNFKTLTMQAGDKADLNVSDANHVKSAKKVTWTSSNKKIATVDKNGVVTAKKKGTATITAQTADKKSKASCKVTVRQKAKKETKVLVAYFSATDTTKGIAEKLADVTGADLYRITPAEEYTAEDLDYGNGSARASKEQKNKNIRPQLKGKAASVGAYDVVFLGYPIWFGAPPKIIYTFLESYDFTGKTIIPFCTSHSSGYNDGEISSIAADGTVLRGRRFSADADRREILDWLSGYGTLDLRGNGVSSVERFDLAAGTNGNAPTVMLNSGYRMPVAGIGTYSLSGQTCVDSVKSALEQGVRLIDTAYMYGNEREVGQAVREFMEESGTPREDIFVITKLYPGEQFAKPEKAIRDALDKLDIGYIDARVIIGLS